MTIAVIVGLLTVALGVLLIALRAGVDREADKAGTRRALLDIGRLRASFDQAVSTIERNIADRSKRYDIPWVVLLHDGDEAARPAIERCGRYLPHKATKASQRFSWVSLAMASSSCSAFSSITTPRSNRCQCSPVCDGMSDSPARAFDSPQRSIAGRAASSPSCSSTTHGMS